MASNWVDGLLNSGEKKQNNDSRLNKLDLLVLFGTLMKLFEEGFTELKQFFEANGHSWFEHFCYKNGHNLGNWVVRQRGQKEKLSPEKVRRLDECNFTWNTIDAKWDEGFNHLNNYKEAFEIAVCQSICSSGWI